jgi:hypothetical protein
MWLTLGEDSPRQAGCPFFKLSLAFISTVACVSLVKHGDGGSAMNVIHTAVESLVGERNLGADWRR